MPSLKVENIERNDNITPISVEVVAKERPKPAVVPPKQQPAPKPKPKPVTKPQPKPIPVYESAPVPTPAPTPEVKKPTEVAKPAPEKTNEPTKPTSEVAKPTPVEAPKLPDIVIPKSSTESTETIAKLPELNSSPEQSPEPENLGQGTVSQELASLNNEYSAASSDNSLPSILDSQTQAITNVYSIDFSTSNETSFMRGENTRKIVSSPPSPKFQLQNHTEVALIFSIDKDGNVLDVRVVKPSTSEVDNLAINYVRGLRFEAVTKDGVDKGEITIRFTVR